MPRRQGPRQSPSGEDPGSALAFWLLLPAVVSRGPFPASRPSWPCNDAPAAAPAPVSETESNHRAPILSAARIDLCPRVVGANACLMIEFGHRPQLTRRGEGSATLTKVAECCRMTCPKGSFGVRAGELSGLQGSHPRSHSGLVCAAQRIISMWWLATGPLNPTREMHCSQSCPFSTSILHQHA